MCWNIVSLTVICKWLSANDDSLFIDGVGAAGAQIEREISQWNP